MSVPGRLGLCPELHLFGQCFLALGRGAGLRPAQASKVCNIKVFFVCWVFVRLPGPSEALIGAAHFGTGQKVMFEHEWRSRGILG